jgi:PRTRC genetic system protein C
VKYGDRTMPMGDLTLEQTKQLMARHFPELADPQVDKKEVKGDVVYTFSKKAGRKGAARRLGQRGRSAAGCEARAVGAGVDRGRRVERASTGR